MLLAGEDDQIFRQSAEVDHRHGCRIQERRHEVAIGRRVDAVANDTGKPERPSEERRVHVVACTRDRTRSQGQGIGLVGRRREARMVTSQRCGMRQKIVPDKHRLGATQMCIGRHERDAGTLGLVCARSHERSHGRLQRRNAPTQIEAQIERDLFVARSACMEASPDVSDAFDQLALDETVNILVRSRYEPRVEAPLVHDGLESVDDRSSIVSRQDTSCTEGLRPSDAAGDVVFEQRAIKAERNAEIEGRRIRRALEPA